MLKFLTIQNYALIRDLEIEFYNGLTVITGETGAGKSILLGALDLILGKRADLRSLLDKDRKCIVEGTFYIKDCGLEKLFDDHDLDFDLNTTIRREINKQGKSRAFVNDTPVKLNILREIAGQLIDIHSQHQTLAIYDSDFQTAIIDSYASLLPEVKNYRTNYRHLQELKRTYSELKDADSKSKKEKDYLNYLLTELNEIQMKPGEQGILEDELNTLEHAEEIKHVLFESNALLDDENSGLLRGLGNLQNKISGIGSFNKTLEELAQRIDSSLIELSDVHSEIEKVAESIDVNPQRLEEVNERLSKIYELQQKHGVNSEIGLLQVKEEIEKKLDKITGLESEIKEISERIKTLNNKVREQAKNISGKRSSSFTKFESEMINILKDLGMEKANFIVDNELIPEPGINGFDRIKFLFNANRGGVAEDVAVIASGGEKSRLMLAIKSTISRKNLLPTILFDEIDSGVSGRVAEKVGNILQRLSEKMQVIAITHLPQIAGKGKNHYLVYKKLMDHSTVTQLKHLDENERIVEIAKLLSGKDITDASIESARHLLDN